MEMKTDLSYKVTMHNDLIKSKSNLSLNEIKLLRLTIMQVMKNDDDFKTFEMPIKQLSDLIGISSTNMYRDIDDITTHLMKELVFIGDGNPKHRWKKFQWVSSCKYEEGIISIRLHDDLKPYLLQLKGLYTQYVLEDVMSLKTMYSIRLYELIREGIRYQKCYADKEAVIDIGIDIIRKTTNTENKYEKYGMFKDRVIEKSLKEINKKTSLYIEYKPIKRSRKVIGFRFVVMSQIGHIHKETRFEK